MNHFTSIRYKIIKGETHTVSLKLEHENAQNAKLFILFLFYTSIAKDNVFSERLCLSTFW